jgi:hypothetical protein
MFRIRKPPSPPPKKKPNFPLLIVMFCPNFLFYAFANIYLVCGWVTKGIVDDENR